MKHRSFWGFLLIVYLAVLLRLTVFREGFGNYPLFSHGTFNTALFDDLIRVYHNNPRTFYYLFLGNIVTFIPVGFFSFFLSEQKKKGEAVIVTVANGLILSVLIEFSQWAFGVGISEIDDLILNTSGVLLGALGGLPFRKK